MQKSVTAYIEGKIFHHSLKKPKRLNKNFMLV